MSETFAVYRCFDACDTLLYVGATKDVDGRIAAHRRKPWGDRIARCVVEHHESASEASEAEYQAIKRENPLFNIRRDKPHYHPTWYRGAFVWEGVALVTLTVAAASCGMSANALAQGIRRGTLPARRFGKMYAVRIEDALLYAREHQGKRGFANPNHPLRKGRGE